MLVNKIKKKPLMIFVGCFIIFLSVNTLLKLAFNLDIFKSFAALIIGK
jgi:hypothetical protein